MGILGGWGVGNGEWYVKTVQCHNTNNQGPLFYFMDPVFLQPVHTGFRDLCFIDPSASADTRYLLDDVFAELREQQPQHRDVSLEGRQM